MKKRMLFLDDRTKRIHSALRQYAADYDVTIVCNVKECLRQLSSNNWDVVSMDHDLRGVDFEDPDSPECGMEVVRYLEKTGWPEGKPKPVFKIHSSNLFASHLMMMCLRRLDLTAYQDRFVYDDAVEHMQYDEKGIPK